MTVETTSKVQSTCLPEDEKPTDCRSNTLKHGDAKAESEEENVERTQPIIPGNPEQLSARRFGVILSVYVF
jgi:hypothetical protein